MSSADEITVVVCGHGPHVGLMVDAIIDITVTDAAALVGAEQDTVVLQEKVTELVDVERVLLAGGVEPDYDDPSLDDSFAFQTELEGALS